MKRSRWGAEPRAKFLTKLEATANVSAAAKAAGYARKHMYELRAEDKDFAAAWDEAEARGCNAIEAEIWRRRIEGVECDVLHGDMVNVEEKGQAFKIREYSEALLLARLEANRPEKHSDRAERTGTDNGAQSSELALASLRATLAAALKRAEAHGKRVMELRALEDSTSQTEQDN
jgi:hypothetical protein